MRHDMAEMDPLFEMERTGHAIVDASEVANVVDWYMIGIHFGNRPTPRGECSFVFDFTLPLFSAHFSANRLHH